MKTKKTLFARLMSAVLAGFMLCSATAVNFGGIDALAEEYESGKSQKVDNIKIGDRITKICNEEVNSINELSDKINDNIVDNSVDIELIRNGKLINTKLNLEEEDNLYKTGLYIKDNVVGLGTLTYIIC